LQTFDNTKEQNTKIFISNFNSDRLIQSECEVLQMSNLVLEQMIMNIRVYLPSLYQCAELISLLDCYTSIAYYSNKTKTGFHFEFFMFPSQYR